VTLQVQFVTMMLMFSSGLLLGMLFDVFRVLSAKLRLPRWTLPLADIFYWIVATILVFRVLIYSNEGQVRVFVFLGILIGICFYFAFLSVWTIRLTLLMIRIVVGLYHFVRRMLHVLLIKPILAVYRLIVLFLGFLVAVAIFLYKIMIQLLYPLWRLLLWIVRPLKKYVVVPVWLTSLWGKVSKWLRKLF
jgi:spore cortex biosynthesis protein YabQ